MRAKPAATPAPVQPLVEVAIPSGGFSGVAAALVAGVVLAGTPGLVGCFGLGEDSSPIAAARWITPGSAACTAGPKAIVAESRSAEPNCKHRIFMTPPLHLVEPVSCQKPSEYFWPLYCRVRPAHRWLRVITDRCAERTYVTSGSLSAVAGYTPARVPGNHSSALRAPPLF